MRLQDLHDKLTSYHPSQKSGLFGAVSRWRGGAVQPKGIYIHGDVGRGKSMLMDLFFLTAPVPQKKRVHFHAFMQDVHHRLFVLRNNKPDLADPLKPLAAELAAEAWLLCFDEFVVQDIADAMILSRLFAAMFELGVVMVATSNVAPADLYKNGLQRERFLPFIDVLKSHVDVFHFTGGHDYRMNRIVEINSYNYPLDGKSASQLALAFAKLTDHEDAAAQILSVKGHNVEITKAARGVAFCKFPDLCEKPYGAGDYLEIAKQFHTVILSGIPQFNDDNRNEGKRFITLIDVLYDNHIQLICSAAVAPMELSAGGKNSFEFERTVSRLLEMQSQDYRNTASAHHDAASRQ